MATWWRGAIGLVALLAAAGCGDNAGTPDELEPTAQLELALSQVPSDAQCLRLTVQAGSRSTTRSSALTPGAASFSATFSGIPVGVAEVKGDIFNVTCANVTTTSIPTWLSETVKLKLRSAVTTSVTLQMRKPSSVQLGVDFCDNAACIKPAVDCNGSCVVDGKVCCARRTASTGVVALACETATACVATPFSTTPESRTPIQCDEHSDCANDQRCSFAYSTAGNTVACRDRNEANKEFATGNNYEVCASPIATEDAPCSGGQFCTVTSDALPGWAFCGCPDGLCGDIGLPTVLSITPASNTTGVASNTPVVITFSEPMDATSAAAAVTVSGIAANGLTRSWNSAGNVLTISANSGWAYATGSSLEIAPRTYTVTVATTAKDKDGNFLGTQATSSFSTLRRITLTLSAESAGFNSTYGYAAYADGPSMCPTSDNLLKVGYHSSVAASGTYNAYARFDLTALGLSSDITTLETAKFSAAQAGDTGGYYGSGRSVGIGLMAPAYITYDILGSSPVTTIGTLATTTGGNPTIDVFAALNQQWSAGGTSAALFQLFKQGTFSATMTADFECSGLRLAVQYLTR